MSSPFSENQLVLFASPNINKSTTHVETERRRRVKLSKQFNALRDAVAVTKSPVLINGTTKTLVLENAVAVINDLTAQIIALELEGERLRSQQHMELVRRIDKTEKMDNRLLDIEVREVDKDVMLIRMQSDKMKHPAAALTTILKELDLDIGYASLSVNENIMTQHVAILNINTGRMLCTKDQLAAVLNAKLIRLI